MRLRKLRWVNACHSHFKHDLNVTSFNTHQIHKILSNTPAAKDGRLKKGDRILAVNGMSMRGLTHRESISVLKVF